MKTISFVFLFVIISAITGCGSSKKLEPGRCEINSDCGVGFKCEATYCEDIYYPEHVKRLP